MDEIECAVIGAGVIGLATARALALAGRETLILEREGTFGSGISSRNSEVIHAGLYYPANSLKARFCVEGSERLYAYCGSRAVAHRRCGKLIVAAQGEEIGELERIADAAARNGVADVVWLDAAAARALEPELNCVAALHSPSTGIVDARGFMLSVLGEAEAHGCAVAYNARVQTLDVDSHGIAVFLGADTAPALKARVVINAAGLDAAPLTHRIKGLAPQFARPSYYAKGNYFTLQGRSPFTRLIYPAPEPGGLGVHLTLDLAGQARFGPDVEWVEAPSFDVDPRRGDKFYAAVRKYWPSLRDGALSPAYCGVRPKLTPPGAPAADFLIEGPATHGVAGLVNLLGVESPGLTSSLAIAEHVTALAAESLDA
jgi:L-2-hydroxyglutarate oxidase LhgO